ncbi:MAG TPA: hypothetical protein RMH85_05010 [Polyangiaceae bacterium LLY-WYZ-15_(1-7)]|nr:hypothetical protein [Polyangiaceae bacterium LLY-WYZ-15_(1-7)]HJL07831.1 hypothetical protein [Polyangiaceae bacterium LLY-WYZ-15_(1-7)]HJL22651.1 hypothetical protein [Polyangiaceae bacterium LLY-WYZ-15_(1-7)]HJL33052.1 hypothetical protein [Polyangiaceae bacterium LLY-WYZ-15_(1-7)]HJL37709.1 hypothetical protein [Polyangiaceae bacterium LLY-WYZ-15_(1-7)]
MKIPFIHATFSGPDARHLAYPLQDWVLQDGLQWDTISWSGNALEHRDDWVEAYGDYRHGVVASVESPYRQVAFHPTGGTLIRGPVVRMIRKGIDFERDELIDLLEDLPFELGAISHFDLDRESPWRDAPICDFPGHTTIGWAVVLKGAGHEHLVSRRWLDNGPWRCIRRKDDLSFLQLCDISAPHAVQVAQADEARRMLGAMASVPCPFPVWLPLFERPKPGRKPRRWTLPERYDAERQTWCGPVEDLSWKHLGRMCVWRAKHRDDPEVPVRTFAVEFTDRVRAQQYLHRLWMCEFEVWVVDGDKRERIDEGYEPPPNDAPFGKKLDLP